MGKTAVGGRYLGVDMGEIVRRRRGGAIKKYLLPPKALSR